MTETATSGPRSVGAPSRTSASRALRARVRDARLQGWLFVLPALVAYGLFVLWPIVKTFKYSLYSWDGVAPAQWVGLDNYKTVFTDHDLLGALEHAFRLIIYFSGIPVVLGLIVASIMRRVATPRVGSAARTVLFLPQVVPLVAAGIAWSWVLSTTGVVNQALSALGLGGVTRAWLGDFGTALPAVGLIGAWVLLGLCTVLLLAGMSKIDPELYEAAQLDGAGPIREFFSITLPSLRHEIGVCVTVTVIAALSAFDIVYISTRGGPGDASMVPGLLIYQLAFFNREVGLASALAVVLMLLVLACVLPIQWLTRRGDES
jgi:raffinose/stachyose/melibiose transport system permease protein